MFNKNPSVDQGTILIIDDNVDTIRLLSAMLKDIGQVLFATSGRTGLKIAEERQPQLILLDVEMPDMDGYQVCELLKNSPDASNASIIFVTGRTDNASEIKALDSGAVDFITKPLNPPVVRARVRTHMKLQHQAMALARLANQDGLTGIFNRRYFDEIIAKEFARHKRQKLPLGLALIDIDHFKSYNDNYGHQKGDDCLRGVSAALNAATRRPGEVVARYGGEEFVVVLPYTPADDAAKYGEWICHRIEELKLEHGYSSCNSFVTISVGVSAGIPDDERTVHQLIGFADQALYLAKQEGRNRMVLIKLDAR